MDYIVDSTGNVISIAIDYGFYDLLFFMFSISIVIFCIFKFLNKFDENKYRQISFSFVIAILLTLFMHLSKLMVFLNLAENSSKIVMISLVIYLIFEGLRYLKLKKQGMNYKVVNKTSKPISHHEVKEEKIENDTIFCENCGEKIKTSSKFCKHCGKKQID